MNETYYKKNKEKILQYHRDNPKYCEICCVKYTNPESHKKNTKYLIKHQTVLHDSLKEAK